MAETNVELFTRGTEAVNRRDIEAMLETLDPDVAYHAALPGLLGGEATVYRGHAEVRELYDELYEALDLLQADYSDIRDLGDRVVGLGRVRTRGKESGAETESPFGLVVDIVNGKATRVRSYLDCDAALAAADLRD